MFANRVPLLFSTGYTDVCGDGIQLLCELFINFKLIAHDFASFIRGPMRLPASKHFAAEDQKRCFYCLVCPFVI